MKVLYSICRDKSLDSEVLARWDLGYLWVADKRGAAWRTDLKAAAQAVLDSVIDGAPDAQIVEHWL